MSNPDGKNDLMQAITALADNQPVAFIASVDEAGFPACKAMLAPRRREGLTVFYFTTNTSSRRVRQFRANPKAAVYFCDGGLFRGFMLQGTMEVLEEPSAKELIWRDGDEEYYPGGVTDPDYCVLRFTAQRGRYYSDFHSEDVDPAGAVPGVKEFGLKN